MTTSIPEFRDLYEEILDYQRHELFDDVLTPWIEKARPAISEFARFKTCSTCDHTDEAAQLAMWNLYALGRVNDLLLLSFQTGATFNKIASVSAEQYKTFFTQLGFKVVSVETFTPFHHEIVHVRQTVENDEPIEILGQLWPGLMFGDMMFSRSGVEVIGGRKYIVKDIAEQSTLYFTYIRQRRNTFDSSKGWGSNSQWRTRFRRDYQTDSTWIYNADGHNVLKTDSNSEVDWEGLTNFERVELCKNRCFIVTSKSHDDLYPFNDRLEETAIPE